MKESQKKNQGKNPDVAALGNKETAEKVEVRTGKKNEDGHYKAEPEIFIGQIPDEIKDDE